MERELFTILMAVLDTLAQAHHRPAKAQYTHRQVLTVWLWAVLHDRPISWATERRHWPVHDRTRALPSGSTLSRRLREPEVVALIHQWVLAINRTTSPAHDDDASSWVIDGKPLPVSGHSQDPDAGVGRTTGGIGRGYKLHAIVDLQGNTHAFTVESLQVSEQAAAHQLLDTVSPPTPGHALLADANYDTNKLHDHAAERGLTLRTPKRYKNAKGLGHRRHSPHRLANLALIAADPEVLAPRRRIEGHFGTMGNVVGGLAPLPNHVRGLERVRRWVAGKLLIDAAHRCRRQSTRAA